MAIPSIRIFACRAGSPFAGEAVATRLSTGDTDVDGAAELMINLFWRGLKGVPSDRDAAETAAGSG